MNVYYFIDVIMFYRVLGIISYHHIEEKINKYL